MRIGVIQYLSHPSLDNCYAGVREALKQSGIKCEITYKVGSNTSAENDCSAFAQDMVTSGYDLIIAIARRNACLRCHGRYRNSHDFLRGLRPGNGTSCQVHGGSRRSLYGHKRCAGPGSSGRPDSENAARSQIHRYSVHLIRGKFADQS